MGHVARLATNDTDRLTYRVLNYKDHAFIKRRQAANGGNQMHGRHIHVWRLETRVLKHGGKEWKTFALNREEWHANCDFWTAMVSLDTA